MQCCQTRFTTGDKGTPGVKYSITKEVPKKELVTKTYLGR